MNPTFPEHPTKTANIPNGEAMTYTYYDPEDICDDPGHHRTLYVELDLEINGFDAREIYRLEPDEENTTGLWAYSGYEYDDDDDGMCIVCFDCFVEDHEDLVGPLEIATRDGEWVAPDLAGVPA